MQVFEQDEVVVFDEAYSAVALALWRQEEMGESFEYQTSVPLTTNSAIDSQLFLKIYLVVVFAKRWWIISFLLGCKSICDIGPIETAKLAVDTGEVSEGNAFLRPSYTSPTA